MLLMFWLTFALRVTTVSASDCSVLRLESERFISDCALHDAIVAKVHHVGENGYNLLCAPDRQLGELRLDGTNDTLSIL